MSDHVVQVNSGGERIAMVALIAAVVIFLAFVFASAQSGRNIMIGTPHEESSQTHEVREYSSIQRLDGRAQNTPKPVDGISSN